jgi:hypothetical protein
MVSRWIEPEPMPKQVDETPPYNPAAPSFDLMKRQVGKKKVNRKSKEFRITEISLLLADRLSRKSYK